MFVNEFSLIIILRHLHILHSSFSGHEIHMLPHRESWAEQNARVVSSGLIGSGPLKQSCSNVTPLCLREEKVQAEEERWRERERKMKGSLQIHSWELVTCLITRFNTVHPKFTSLHSLIKVGGGVTVDTQLKAERRRSVQSWRELGEWCMVG